MTPFPLPMMFASWGLSPGTPGDRFDTATELADWAKSCHIKTVALQLREATREQVKTLQDKNIFVVVWDVMNETSVTKIAELKPDGIMPQIEGPDQFDGCVRVLKALQAAGNTLPLAVVTTYWGLYDPTNDTTIRSGSKWREIAALGIKAAFVECYAADAASHANLDGMLFQGTVYGIPAASLFAVCGTYRGEMPAAYIGLDKLDRSYAVYLAEPMSGAQWTAWGAVNLVTTVNYWQVIDKTTGRVLHEERATTWQEDGKTVTGLGKCIDYMSGHKDAIRISGDFELKRVSH